MTGGKPLVRMGSLRVANEVSTDEGEVIEPGRLMEGRGYLTGGKPLVTTRSLRAVNEESSGKAEVIERGMLKGGEGTTQGGSLSTLHTRSAWAVRNKGTGAVTEHWDIIKMCVGSKKERKGGSN